MRASLTTTALTAAFLLSATAAHAQSAGQASGLRYMNWNGRATTPATMPAQPAAEPAARRDLRRPNPVIPHGGGFATAVPASTSRLTPAPGSSGRLTPADAWRPSRDGVAAAPQPIAPQPTPPQPVAPQPRPQPQPQPTAPEIAYEAPPATVIEPPRELSPRGYPDYLPNRGARQYVPSEIVQPVQPTGQPVYGDQPEPQGPAAQPQSSAADPMAPRRDAPIFQLQRPAPVVQGQPSATADPDAPHQLMASNAAPTSSQPPQQGARRYSVHRQNGQEPDGVTIPEPTYVDALVMTLGDTPASQDLAQPDRGPNLIRDNKGRLRAAPAASDGDHQ